MASTQNLEIVIRSNIEQAKRSFEQLQAALHGALEGIQSEGNQTGNALDAAFRTLGVRGVKEVETEVKKLLKALEQVERSNALPADKQAAVEAYKRRVAELRSQLQPTSAAMQQMGEQWNVQIWECQINPATKFDFLKEGWNELELEGTLIKPDGRDEPAMLELVRTAE